MTDKRAIARAVFDYELLERRRHAQAHTERLPFLQRRQDLRSHRAPRDRLVAARIALIGGAQPEVLAHQQPWICLERDARAIAGRESGHVHAGGQHARRAFVEHERHRRIDELHRAGRAGRKIGRAVRVAAAGCARIAVGVERSAQLDARQRRAVCDEIRPLARPAEVVDQLARQAEGEIEAADPRAGARQQRLELGKRAKPLDLPDAKRTVRKQAHGRGDRLRAPRRAGEINAVDPQPSSSRSAASGGD